MSNNITRDYKVTFNGWPTLRDLKQELTYVERVYGDWSRIEIETNGSSDEELVEVYLYLTRSTA